MNSGQVDVLVFDYLAERRCHPRQRAGRDARSRLRDRLRRRRHALGGARGGDARHHGVAALAASGTCDTAGEPLPAQVLSANAYLGALPIAAALAAGADIVVTLGPSVSPLIAPCAFLLDKGAVPVTVTIGGGRLTVPVPRYGRVVPHSPVDSTPTDAAAAPDASPGDVLTTVPLVRLA